jgi:uncharacterized protein (DUF924 family)
MADMQAVETVLQFWFDEAGPGCWWRKDQQFDQMIGDRFGFHHGMACRGELFPWRATGRGRLAEIIVLDQFSRNIYRDQPGSFAHDGMALVLAQEAVALEVQRKLSAEERAFLYMPYMHSESLVIHDLAVTLYSEAGLEENLDFELRHRAIIERFGRYPHRNTILGRDSTPEELEFLQQPGSGF